MFALRASTSLTNALAGATRHSSAPSHLAQNVLSPLALVAQDLNILTAPGTTPAILSHAVFGILQRNGFHTSSVLSGGRYSNYKPEKGSSWRNNLSKKAKKRLKRQKETTVRRAKSMPQNLTDRQSKQTSALAVAQDRAAALLPSKMELQLQSENNRTVIESVTMPESFPEKRSESLLRVDPVAYRSSLDAAMAAASPSARTGLGMTKRWNTYLRILAAHGKLVEATQAYKEMRQAGLRATEYTLCALLTACAQERNISAARTVWTALTGGLPVPGGEDKTTTPPVQAQYDAGHVSPTSACYGALIQCHVRAQDLTGAFAVLAAAERAGITMKEPTLWTHLIAGCSHAGQYERAIETFEHMRTFHCKPDVHAYTTLIGVYGRLDEVEKVLDLVTEMKQLGPQPNAMTYNAAINAAGRSTRRFKHAHDMFWEMDALGFARDVRSYQGVLLACSHNGEVARAREYMAHMTGRGIKPDLICFNTLLTVYARALRDTSLKPGSGKKLMGKVNPEDVAQEQASGIDLPALDAQGALSRDPDAVKDAELMNENRLTKAVSARSRELRHGHARRVLGPVDDVVDAMLADYFGSSSQRQAEEEKELEAFEKGESPDSDAFAGPDSEEVLDVQDPAWLKLRSALTSSGVVDEEMMEDLEMEYGQRHADNVVEEQERAKYYEKRHKERMSAMEDELLDIASEEAGMRGDKVGAAAARAVRDSEANGAAYDSSSASEDEFTDAEEGSDEDVIDVKPESSGPSTTGMRGVFADVAQRVEQVTGKPLGAAASKAGGPLQLEEREEEQTSSDLILAAARSGSRIPMREYLAALEREVMEGSFGPQWEYETADEGDALMTLQAKARARGLAAKEQALEEDALRAELGLPREVDATVQGEAGAPPAAQDGQAGLGSSDPSLQILDVANVPESATERHPVAIRGPDGQIRVLRRRWLSMFGRVGEDEDDDVAMLGGVRLKDLFNVNTIPLPPHWKKTIERGALREDVDFEELEDLDPGELYEHTEAVLRARIHAALIREAMGITGPIKANAGLLQKQAKRLVEAMSVEKDLFNDPLLSDNAEEYASLAGVRLPDMSKVRKELAEMQGVEDEAAAQEMEVPGLDDPDVEGDRDADEDAVARLRAAAAETLEAIGGYDGAEGKVPKAKGGKAKAKGAGVTVQGEQETAEAPVTIPKEGEEVLLSALSATSPTLPSSPEERAMAEDPDGLSPVQRAHRAFTARVLSRVLAVHPIGPVERLLVDATESADKVRQRKHNQQEPGLLDALFAVQRLKQQATEGSGTRHVKADVNTSTTSAKDKETGQPKHTGPSSDASAPPAAVAVTVPASVGGGVGGSQDSSLTLQGEWVESPLEVAMQQAEDASEAVRKSPLVAAMVQARQEARQADARQTLTKAAQEDEGTSARLKALVQLSNTVMAGAAWLPATPYPLDRGEKRKQLLLELSRIYRREFSAQGLVPDKVTLNVMINAYASAGDSSSAYAFLHDQFPAAGVQPDVRTFRALMRMHVKRKEDERALELLRTMPSLGIQPDKDCYGVVVHARARDWRVKEAITLVQEAKSRGLTIPEEYAKLLRQRCKSMGIFHPDVPAHPIGWQFSPEVMKKRFAGAKSKEARRQTAFLKPVMNKMR